MIEWEITDKPRFDKLWALPDKEPDSETYMRT